MLRMSHCEPGEPLHHMFTALSPRYDLVNRFITLGFDQRWRRAAARVCLASSPQQLLDLGCGTGDLAIAIARLARGNLKITGLDYSEPMLELARRKAGRLNIARVDFVSGDATHLSFPNDYFDCVGMSFAFRNLSYRNPLGGHALAEVLRVLKPGGRFVVVESSQPKSRLVRWLFHLYLRFFVARVGYFLSGNKGAYRYLAESATHFLTPEEVKNRLVGTGFREVFYRSLLLGVAAIHVAFKN